MSSAFSFKDHISLANGKFLNFIDTNNIRKDVIGMTLGSNDLHIKSVGGNVVINDGSASITYLNTNNNSPVMINSKLAVGYGQNIPTNNLITLNKNGFIGANANDGYLGIGGGLYTTTGSRILLHGNESTTLGNLELYGGSSTGRIELFTDNKKRLTISNTGNISLTPNGSAIQVYVTNETTEISNSVILHSETNSINPTTGGALTIKGGAAVEKDLYVGGVLFVDDLSSFNLTSEILTTANLKLSDTTDATSTTHGGPLTVAGGASVAKNLFVGGSIVSSSNSFSYSGSFRDTVDSVSEPAIVPGFNFTDFVIRSFKSTISVSVKKSDVVMLYRSFDITGIKSTTHPSGWILSIAGFGDTLNYTFTLQKNNGIVQLYYQSPGINEFQMLSVNYNLTCITNIDAVITIPHSVRPETFGLENTLVPGGILITNSIGNHVFTDNNLTFYNNNMTISGNIVPADDLVYNLGAPDKQWNDLYLSGNTIHLGPCRLSANVNSSDSCMMNFSSKTHSKTHLYMDGYTISKLGSLSCSDQRLKSNIKSIDLYHSLNIVRKLEPKEYTLKDNPRKKSYGFLAQDLQKLIPSSIVSSKTIIPLSINTAILIGDRLVLSQPLLQDEVKYMGNKKLQLQINHTKYNVDVVKVTNNFVYIKDTSENLANLPEIECKVNGYIDNHVLHVEKDSLYTFSIASIKVLDQLLQNEIQSHNQTKMRLDKLEKLMQELIKHK